MRTTSVGDYLVQAMGANYRAHGIGKQGESINTRGGTKIELDYKYGRGKGHGDGAAKFSQRDEDWLCLNTGCGNVNFAFRGACNRCGAAHPAGVGGASGGRGRGMRPGGRVDTASTVKKGFQTVRVEMSFDNWKKWCHFKRMYMEDKQLNEDSNTFMSAASTNSGGNTYHTMGHKTTDRPWLIDSGASRHMVGSYENFVDYAPNLKRQSVRLVGGSSQTILGSGTITCGSNMPLLSELYTGKRLGTGIMRDDLYYLDDKRSPVVAAVLSQSSFDAPDRDNETWGEKGEEINSTTSREVVVGVIPLEDSHNYRDVGSTGEGQEHMQGGDVGSTGEGQEEMQGERKNALDEVLHWPKPNEEQEVRVYTRRQRAEKNHVQVQGEKNTPLGQNPEDLVQPSTHDSISSSSANDRTLSLPLDDLDIPIAHRIKGSFHSRKIATKSISVLYF